MTEDQKQVLERQLWNIANELRGKMDPFEFKDYILGFIFYKYLSERQLELANDLLQPEGGRDYSEVTDPEEIQAIKDESLDELGYFLHPDEMFSQVVAKGQGASEEYDTNIILDLKTIFNNIVASANQSESRDDFNNLFEDLNLDSTKLGKEVDSRNELIVKIMASLDRIDFGLNEAESDVLGDAYEYLIAQFASGAGKKAGEFYTPQQVSKVLAKLVTLGRDRIRNAYDPTCGSGSLLLRIEKDKTPEGEDTLVELFGQELNRTTFNLARMNMILHEVHFHRFDIRQEDTLEKPQHIDLRFEAVVLPHGVLFRGQSEGAIRRYIIEELNCLDAVIGLPANLFYGTGIPACILVMKKCRKQDDAVIFIDASKDFQKNGNQNTLTDQHVDRILEIFESRETTDKYSYLATLEEIRDNDYNLNIPRYVDTFEDEEPVDLEQVSEDLKKLDSEMEITDGKIEKFCKELGIETPF